MWIVYLILNLINYEFGLLTFRLCQFRACLVSEFENCCLEFFEICVGEKVCSNVYNVV